MTPLHVVLDGAESDNFAACAELWRRFKAVRPDLADRVTPANQPADAILTERQKAAMVEWARREVRGQAAAALARQMNAELPPEQHAMLKLKGMI